MILGTILAMLAFGAVAYADIHADPYYASAGDTVQFTGDEMNAGEDVSVDVKYPDNSLAQHHVVQADADGKFADSYTIKDDDPGGIYTVTATGQDSGNTFTTEFDPANNINTTTTLSIGTTPITIGGSTTLSGTLAWTAGTYNQGQQSKDGRTIHINSYASGGCGGSPTLINNATTTGGGVSGTASYSYNFTPATAGTYHIRAVFDGFELGSGGTKDTYQSSQSSCLDLVVNLLPTSLSQTLTPSTFIYGQQTAISGGSTGIPTGSTIAVSRYANTGCSGGGTSLGSPTTDGSGNWDSLSFKPSGASAAGNYGIGAHYAGDATHAVADDCDALTVNQAPTFVVSDAVVSSPILLGGSAFVNYKVESGYGIAGDNAAGTTTIVQDSGPAGMLGCTGGGGFSVAENSATTAGASDDGFGFLVNAVTNNGFRFTCTPTATGTYTFHVHNSGNSNYAASDGSTLTLIVNSPMHDTTTNVVCSPASVPVNVASTCTATVTDTNASPTTPTGTVTFSSDASGSFDSATCSLSGSPGTCSVQYTPDPGSEGTHNIGASYGGDGTHNASSDATPFPLTATVRATSTAVSCTPTSIILNGTTTCTATVTDTSGGTKITPTGNVTLATNSTGTFTGNPCTLAQDSLGVAKCTVTYQATVVGSHKITGSYPGDTDHSSSSDTTGTTITVTYGVCYLYDKTKSNKAGSTAPIKFFLCDVNGNDVSSSSIVVKATTLKRKDTSASGVLEDSGQANSPDSNFRFDATLGPSGGYIFNLSTKSPSPALGAGTTALGAGTWVLTFTVDGVSSPSYVLEFDVK